MKKVIKYEAFDGKVFDSENECRVHEHYKCNEMIDTVKQIHEICVNHDIICTGCPFYDGVSCIIAVITRERKMGEEINPSMWEGKYPLH